MGVLLNLIPKGKEKVTWEILSFRESPALSRRSNSIKRGVCGSGAHSLSLQDEASPSHSAPARLAEPLLCTDLR